MNEAGRAGARQQDQGKDENAVDAGRKSGPQPSSRGYEPFPIGADAFATPLAPTPSEPPRFSRRVRLFGLIAGVAAGVGVGALACALILRHTPKEPSSEQATGALQASAAAESERAVGLDPAKPAVPDLPQATPSAPQTQAATPSAPKLDAAAPQLASSDVHAAVESSAAGKANSAHHASDPHKSAHSHSAKLPPQPERGQVIAAMSAVRPKVIACFGDARGAATANVRISGSSGRISSVQVVGQPGAIGSCIARAVRNARFPHFAQDSLAISYPFSR